MAIRVLIWDVSQLLTEIMTLICSHEPDLEVMAPKGKLNLLEAVEADRPDVIIIGEGNTTWKETCDQVLRAYPRVRVISLKNDGREAYLCRLTLEQTLLGELSPENLVTVIQYYEQQAD